jgi:Protein of unknown function (DUF3987)
MTDLLGNLPEEMRAYDQWILWRSEDVGAKKPSKTPYQCNGWKADITNPKHYSSYTDCIAVLRTGNYSGLGFCLTVNDPYSIVDLDDAKGDKDVTARQISVFEKLDSYSEISPSGNGLHIIVRGKVPTAKRFSNIEIYSQDRYMTMTGDVHGNKTLIHDRQDELTQLWEQMGGNKASQPIVSGDNKDYGTDEEIIKRALSAINGDKFKALHAGDWQRLLYPSQSEADFAYIDIIAFYTQNRNQIARIFRGSKLGTRDKANRRDYVEGMITRSFDRQVPLVNIEGMQDALKDKLANDKLSNDDSRSTNSLNGVLVDIPDLAPPSRLELPPGLMGEIARFVYQAAPRPVEEIALAAAISLMAGICGRTYNISGTGLNNYVLLLAMTGAGKEASQSGITKLMGLVDQQLMTTSNFIGPSEISSGPALFKYLHKNPCFLSMLGEFGLRLQQMTAAHANGAEISLRGMLLKLYSKSGLYDVVPMSVYSDQSTNIPPIPSPNFSILGESTPERFYDMLNEEMISEGFLPRFMIIEYKGKRPVLNVNHSKVLPSFQLISDLKSLCSHAANLNNSNPRKVIDVQTTPEAQALFDDFNNYCDNKINSSNRDVIRQLWNRGHLKVLKLSALVAVGQNMYDPVIDADTMRWSADLVQRDIENITVRFEAGEIGANSYEIKQTGEILKAVKTYIMSDYKEIEKYMSTKGEPLHFDKVIPYVYLNKRLSAMSAFRNDKNGATFALKRAIQILVDTERLSELNKLQTNKYNTYQRCFMLNDLRILD